MIERLIAANTARKRPGPQESQGDCGNRRREESFRRASRGLRSGDEHKRRHERKDDRGTGHNQGGGDNQRSFGVAHVNQRARRSLHDQAGDGRNRHDETDLIFRPMPPRQEIDREIGSKPLANVGQEEVQGIQRMFVAHESFRERRASLA